MPSATKTTTKTPTKPDPLDALVAAGPERALQLLLWKARHREPDMYVQITPEDIQGLEDCARFLKVKFEARIHRPEGLAAQEAVPASHGRRGVPGRDATPPRNYVVVTLVEKGTGNAIRPVENNETDYDTARDQAAVRKARDQAPDLARRLIEQGNTGDVSLSDHQDAADALLILARAAQG